MDMRRRDYVLRHSIRFWRNPERFLVHVDPAFDAADWARDKYTWERDPWGGLLDHAARPADTVASGRGDCVDFAVVMASWLASRGDTVLLGLSFTWHIGSTLPIPRHMVVSDGEFIYEGSGSRGPVHWSLGDYLESAGYDDVYFKRIPGERLSDLGTDGDT